MSNSIEPVGGPPQMPHQHPLDSKVPSGFAKLLGPTATPDQIAKAMAQLLNSMIAQIKENTAKAHETAKKIKDQIEGKDQ